MITELKTFNPEANSFMANGKKYLIHGSLSTFRYKYYEIYQAQMAWGVDFQKQYKDIGAAYDLLNKSKPADAAVHLNNMREGIARHLEKREHPAMMLCTLFISREGEDLSTWNETEAMEKVADWNTEGYEMVGFFKYALRLVEGLDSALEALSANTLQQGEPTKN